MNERKGSSTRTTHDKFASLLKSAIHFNSLCILLHCLTSEPKGLYFTFFILLYSNPIWHTNIKECIKSFSAQQNVLLQVSTADYAWNVSFTANNAIKLTYYAMCFLLFANNTGRFFYPKPAVFILWTMTSVTIPEFEIISQHGRTSA